MAEISAKVVMDLRGRTGCGMMDCKKALAACDGDLDKAIDYLREKGLAKAAKKQSRIAAEGVVGAYICEKCGAGALVEVNCETDFVANTPEFKDMVQTIAKIIVMENPADVEALLNCKAGDAQTVNDMITEKVAKIGEKITVRRFARYEAGNGIVDSYIHMGGKVGVLVQAECEVTDAVKEVLHDVALQIAAASPVAPEYVTRDQVNPEHLHHETEILAAQHAETLAPMLDKLGIYRNEALVRTAYEICRWHHERWDGRGYPDGLSGDRIPISAQVVSMADVYDALVSKRVYKAAYAPDTAVQMILHGDCGTFNPLLLECLVEIQDVLKEDVTEVLPN